MLSVESIYSDVDNLSELTHPETGARFSFLPDEKLLSLAEQIVDAIAYSDITNVILSETGASPLAEICSWVAAKQKLSVSFQRVKFPREPLANIFHVLNWYLTPEERAAVLSDEEWKQLIDNRYAQLAGLNDTSLDRESLLRLLCEVMPPDLFQTGPTSPAQILTDLAAYATNPFQSATQLILKGTRMSKRVAGPFVYFDEYVDSGTTLRNAVTFFGCYSKDPDMHVATYYLNDDDPDALDRVLIALADARQKYKCHPSGAYPFENRVDLIGHFYRIADDAYTFTRVADIQLLLMHANANAPEIRDFIRTLESMSINHQLLFELRHAVTIDQLKHYFDECHVLRHAIWQLELAHGNPDFAEFLFQAFDMYGPSWSPMPTDFHFDFWKAAKVLEEVLRTAPEYEILAAAYKAARQPLIKKIADVYQARRESWLERMKGLVEDRYVSDRNQTVGSGYPYFSAVAG